MFVKWNVFYFVRFLKLFYLNRYLSRRKLSISLKFHFPQQNTWLSFFSAKANWREQPCLRKSREHQEKKKKCSSLYSIWQNTFKFLNNIPPFSLCLRHQCNSYQICATFVKYFSSLTHKWYSAFQNSLNDLDLFCFVVKWLC